MIDTYYYHLDSENLAQIIVSALICPVTFISERKEDLQDLMPDQMLLSKKKWHKDYDTSIELVLTAREKDSLREVSNDYFVLDGFLPISRIIKIYFPNEDKLKIIHWNIENGAGFVPSNWISVEGKEQNEVSLDIPEKTYYPTLMDNSNVLKQIGAFNRLLGGLAFMRIALVDNEDELINYPINYISTFSFFNKKVEEELKAKKPDYKKTYHEIFQGDTEIYKFLHKKITIDILGNIARERGKELKEKFNIVDPEQFRGDRLLYNLSILYNYGEGKPKKTVDLIGSFITKQNWRVKEEVGLIYGLHYGYKSLRNLYKIGGNEWEVKFRMDQKLDFYLLESVYQFVLDKNSSQYEFSYLDPIVPRQKGEKVPFNYEAYNILNTLIITKENRYQEGLIKIIRQLSKELISWFPKEVFSINQKEFEKKMKKKVKNDYADIIKEVQGDIIENINLNELLKEEKYEVKNFSIDPEKSKTSDLYQDPEEEKSVVKTWDLSNAEIKTEEEDIGAKNNPKSEETVKEQSENLKKVEESISNDQDLGGLWAQNKNVKVASHESEGNFNRIENLSDLTVKDLKKIAKERGLKGISNLKKDQLIEKIKNNLE
ncbi:Rho termination factor N-terminal domain-containing protein [Christiangramia sp.]|uniref:Rho termination factor N-terminal domain-containing protein n=1 Tax=Christiangramia sp. TaxID=1931228 RepID=UPI002608FBF7|nr:Rho termination factor N-terminal domain-containing protein [Christiangramia sp.]